MKKPFDLSNIQTMTSLIDAVFSEMNLGMFIYQMENTGDANTLKLVYANKQASQYTGADMSLLIGKYILEAFPPLAKTDIPELYAEVVNTKKSCNVGAFEYLDEKGKKRLYAVKAFPIPNDCLGVIFENITTKKQLEEMLAHRAGQNT